MGSDVVARRGRVGALGASLLLGGCGRLGYDAIDSSRSLDAAAAIDVARDDVGALDADLDAASIDAASLDTTSLHDAALGPDGGDDVTCGDGIVEESEECDDSNSSARDGCEPTCFTTRGFVCVGEPSRCSATCGDGALAPAEECDDGDRDLGDGCGATCRIEAGFACNRGQAPRFAFRRGRSDCVEVPMASLAAGTLYYTEDATIRVRHVGGAYRYAAGPWVASARVTPWIDGSSGLAPGATIFAPPGTRTPADEVSRSAAIEYAARAGPLDLSSADVRTVSLSIWDSACGDNTDDMTVWRVDRLSRCEPAPPGLVSWLPLDDSFVDAIPGRPALPEPASHGFSAGVHGWMLRLNAPSSLDTSALTSPGYTVAFWFGLADRASPPPRSVDVLGISGAQISATVTTPSALSLRMAWAITVTPPDLDLTLEHHVAITVSAEVPPRVSFFVDGADAGGGTSAAVPPTLGPSVTLSPGVMIDDLRLYDRPLAAAEIAPLAAR